MAGKRKEKPVQLDLWGNPIKPEPQPSRAVMALDFDGNRVRTINRSGQMWWVLADVAKVLGYNHVPHASRLLRDSQKGVHKADTLGGSQEITIISEGGLYRLIMKSRSESADSFQDWVTDEVLPSIRQHGCYPPPLTRVTRWKQRLNCDDRTAASREKNCEINISMHSRLAGQGASPREFQNIHNATYRGQFEGQDCQAIKKVLGTRRTPLDRMSSEVLAANFYAKVLAERKIMEENIPLDRQPEVYEESARAVAIGGLAHLGPEFRYGIDSDNPRGPILDVIQLSLPSPN